MDSRILSGQKSNELSSLWGVLPLIKGHEDSAEIALTDTRIKQLLRKGGCLAESRKCYGVIRRMTVNYLTDFLKNAYKRLSFEGTEMMAVDTVLVSEPYHASMLGFGGRQGIRYVWNDAISALRTKTSPESKISPVGFSILNDICTDVLSRMLDVAVSYLRSRPSAAEGHSVSSEEDWYDEDCAAFRATHRRLINAGAADENGALDASQQIHIFYDEHSDECEKLDKPVLCLTPSAISLSVHSLFSGDLVK